MTTAGSPAHAVAGTYRNPLLPGDRPDPAILKDGDEYWLTYSSFDSAPGLPLYRSTDLVNWTHEGNALSRPPGIVFAVDIAKVGDRYFIYIPFIPAPWSTEITAPSIYAISAPSMRGPWSEPVDLGIRGAIDPGHLTDDDDQQHLFTSGIRHAPLADDSLTVLGDLEYVYSGWEYPEEWITEAYALEGPKLFRRGQHYFLVSAVGGTAGPATGHMVIVARSTSPSGPWENCPDNPIARTKDASEKWWSRGHATIFEGPGRSWWMLSHGYENGYRTLGRQLLLEPIEWTEDNWPVAGAPILDGALAAPLADTVQLGEHGYTDPLTPLRLGERWSFYAPGPQETDRASETSNGLALQGKGTGPASSSPLTTLVGAHSYSVEVTLTLSGPGVEAGLLLFFNNHMFCGFGISDEGMSSYSGGKRSHWREPMPPTRRVSLRLDNHEHVVTSWYRVHGGEWTRHAVRYETSGYNANTMADLQGLRPAMYASGDGEAIFTDFVYTPNAN